MLHLLLKSNICSFFVSGEGSSGFGHIYQMLRRVTSASVGVWVVHHWFIIVTCLVEICLPKWEKWSVVLCECWHALAHDCTWYIYPHALFSSGLKFIPGSIVVSHRTAGPPHCQHIQRCCLSIKQWKLCQHILFAIQLKLLACWKSGKWWVVQLIPSQSIWPSIIHLVCSPMVYGDLCWVLVKCQA